MRIARRVVVTGRVQGVYFRAWTSENAQTLGLDGWVRNRRDGSVEAVFAGPEADVLEMIALCRQGPPAACVSEIKTVPTDDPGETGFRIAPTV